ncbi:MAG TPA: hypothetical protein VJ872_04300 [Nocardioides sp.]|nr:hypothetical protein [Nocardioides sp.]
MNRNEQHTSPELIRAICRELMRLAQLEDDSAADEAARTPYWAPTPLSVLAHRRAAASLRAAFEQLDAGLRIETAAS